ncbi:MAG: lytic transglycosylase domain-containing protein [Desulfobacterales bacterium]
MNPVRRFTKLIICLFLIGHGQPAFSAVKNNIPNLEARWNHYLSTDARKTPITQFPFEHCFKSAAQKHDLPLSLLLAVARGESNFNPKAKSNRNCHGLMQIQWPETAKHLGIYRLSALYDPCTNVDAGTKYLKELLDRYDKNLHLALAAYNYGPNRIDKTAVSGQIPEGAKWYSGYIFHHLEHIMRGATTANGPSIANKRSPYRSQKHIAIITFTQPYRAAGFYDHLQKQAPELNLEWYRIGLGRYQVVMLYSDKQALENGKIKLRNLGIRVK